MLKPWLEQVLPGTDVWLSSEDIDKGTIWFTEIIGELERCHCGVICVTRENYLAPWIHFEAGGMVTGLGKSHIATILLDIDYPELRQPLNQFNGLRVNREGAFHLVKSFNKLSDRPIKDHVLERTFEKFWPDWTRTTACCFLTRTRSRRIWPSRCIFQPPRSSRRNPREPATRKPMCPRRVCLTENGSRNTKAPDGTEPGAFTLHKRRPIWNVSTVARACGRVKVMYGSARSRKRDALRQSVRSRRAPL